MLTTVATPLVRLGNLFPDRQVYAKCEHLAPSGCFKIRGAVHLLRHLSRDAKNRQLVVPSMGNTALGTAVAANEFGFAMTGVVPQTISRAKDEKLQALGVELVKIAGGGTDLLQRATQLAQERGAYFVHPHLDPLWTDGYQAIAEEIFRDLPDCRSLVFPVGGGGLLMGLTEFLMRPPPHPNPSPPEGRGARGHPANVKLIGCEAYNFPTYARFDHARSKTIADGLILEIPHPKVQERINAVGVEIRIVQDAEIRSAMAELFSKQGMIVEPSSAITAAFVRAHHDEMPEPICVIFTGENITREDFLRLIDLA